MLQSPGGHQGMLTKPKHAVHALLTACVSAEDGDPRLLHLALTAPLPARAVSTRRPVTNRPPARFQANLPAPTPALACTHKPGYKPLETSTSPANMEHLATETLQICKALAPGTVGHRVAAGNHALDDHALTGHKVREGGTPTRVSADDDIHVAPRPQCRDAHGENLQ